MSVCTQSGTCSSDAQCASQTGALNAKCVSGACRMSCTSDRDCGGSGLVPGSGDAGAFGGQVCGTDGFCEPLRLRDERGLPGGEPQHEPRRQQGELLLRHPAAHDHDAHAGVGDHELTRVAELVWEGKYERGVRVLPARAPVLLHTDEVHEGGGAGGPWKNRLVLGDQADVLPTLARDLAGQVSLVYVDPPFETGGEFDFQASVHGSPGGSGPRGDASPRLAVPAYRDSRGLDAWLAWFDGAMRSAFDLLALGGSLYVHLDAHVAPYAKVVLDEVFGPAPSSARSSGASAG